MQPYSRRSLALLYERVHESCFPTVPSCWLLLLQETEEELLKERDCVGHLIPGATRAVCMITEDTMLPGEA